MTEETGMIEVVDLLIRETGFSSLYLTQKIPLDIGDFCLVETAIGLQIAEVIEKPRIMKRRFIDGGLPKVIRKAQSQDIASLEKLKITEREAFEFCIVKVKERQLKMKLIKVIFAFDYSKALFMFTAENRVDFRELVRDLAHRFKTRIEMKQIGVRDEARLLGGIGNCGYPLCCLRFLKNFHPVSIKMAKDQGLSLIPSKISGICGRLMCCLQYEHEAYVEQMKKMPRIGRRVHTPKGEGKVRQINVLKGLVTVEIGEGDTHDFKAEEISMVSSNNQNQTFEEHENN